jgi:SdpC family antimicrobial peptide
MFGHGEVASAFPEILDRSETLSDEALKAADQRIESMDRAEIREAYKESRSVSPAEYHRLTKSLSARLADQIEQSNPDFFRQFERRMKSGNPMKVQKALASMSEVTTPALAEVLDVSEEALRTGENVDLGTGQGKCITFAAAVNVAVFVNGAVNVNVAVNVNGVYNVNKVENRDFSRTRKDSSLNQEMLTRRVADRLAT